MNIELVEINPDVNCCKMLECTSCGDIVDVTIEGKCQRCDFDFFQTTNDFFEEIDYEISRERNQLR